MYVDPITGEIKVFVRAGFPFNYDTDEASLESGLVNLEPSKTQQQFAEEVDINTIVRRFGLSGDFPDAVKLPHYGDFTQVTDYQTALNAVRAAEEHFMELPAAVRAEFNNDPQQLLNAVEDRSNEPRLRKLGLLREVPPPEPIVAPEGSKTVHGKKEAKADPDQSST